MNYKNWDGTALKGLWMITIKIDGVQARKVNGKLVSKNNKPLYNIPDFGLTGNVFEIFCGSWNETMSIVMASKSERREVRRSEVFHLYPRIHPDLYIGTVINPSVELINIAFNQALADEHEGLVLRNLNTDEFIKVKPEYSEDVKITGYQEGEGKFKGMLGKFTTVRGDVGVGFTNEQRIEFWENREDMVGSIIEVLATNRSVGEKLSHPRFVRLRSDK